MQRLIDEVFVPALSGDGTSGEARGPASALSARERHDGALLALDAESAKLLAAGARLAFTTDGYVVKPLVFSGGDVGSLAVHGTVNDLAMCGARPLWLSAAFVLEEGLPLDVVRQVARSMGSAAREAGVALVTGDTKVVERGKGDGIYVTTAGVGLVPPGVSIGPQRIRPGDAVLLSGDLGRHGIAVLARREGLELESPIESDSAPLSPAVSALLEAGLDVHCLRDLTRGGLASALVELTEAAGLEVEVAEAAIPIGPEVAGACEVLGLDPLHVANEGRFVCFLPSAQADAALEVLRGVPVSAGATRIGEVRAAGPSGPLVVLETALGTRRVVDMLSGEQLPRIC